MSLRLVRCPFCGRRFNITGIPAGTRLRCGFCTAVLSVPKAEAGRASRFGRSALLQVGGGVAAGLAVAFLLYFLLRPSEAVVQAAPAVAGVASRPPSSEAEPVPPGSVTFADPSSRAKQEILEDFGTGILFYEGTKPYLVAVEPSERYFARDLTNQYAERLEALMTAFCREFGDPLGFPEVKELLPVIVLASRESFDRYCEAHDNKRLDPAIKGIYEYGRRRVVLYHDFGVATDVLFHEGVHQLVHHHTLRYTQERRDRAVSTYWFQEGTGTYFEGFKRRPTGEIAIDVSVNHGRLATLKQTLHQHGMADFIPLSVLVGMTVEDFWRWYQQTMSEGGGRETLRKAQLYYAESWAFVHFLRQKGGNHRRVFDEYFRAETAGRGGKEVFEGLVRDHLRKDLSELEKEFVEYILALR
jgi:hypothetical protein